MCKNVYRNIICNRKKETTSNLSVHQQKNIFKVFILKIFKYRKVYVYAYMCIYVCMYVYVLICTHIYVYVSLKNELFNGHRLLR